MYRHILIPTDGSELAEQAVTNGLSLAKSLGAKVTVIIVEEPNWPVVSEPKVRQSFVEHGAFSDFRRYTEEINEQIKNYAARALNRVADAAKQAGVPCDTVQVRDVQPYQAIIATAADKGCDLIVMASHGRGGLSRWFLGSVAEDVVRRSIVPVMLVRAQKASEPELAETYSVPASSNASVV